MKQRYILSKSLSFFYFSFLRAFAYLVVYIISDCVFNLFAFRSNNHSMINYCQSSLYQRKLLEYLISSLFGKVHFHLSAGDRSKVWPNNIGLGNDQDVKFVKAIWIACKYYCAQGCYSVKKEYGNTYEKFAVDHLHINETCASSEDMSAAAKAISLRIFSTWQRACSASRSEVAL